MDLYSAAVTSVPFLLLGVLADLSVFGPRRGSSRRAQRWDGLVDVFALLFLAAAFGSSLWALYEGRGSQFAREVTASGLALGGVMVVVMAFGKILALYRRETQHVPE